MNITEFREGFFRFKLDLWYYRIRTFYIMTSSHQISFVSFSNITGSNVISHIGGVKPDGTTWKVEIEKAIGCMEKGDCSFYIWDGFQRVKLVIAICESGYETLKSEQDSAEFNILHSLPTFPEKLVAI